MFSLVKKSVVVALGLVSTAAAFAAPVTLNVPLKAEVLDVQLACVRFVNSSGESAGVEFIFDEASYPEVEKARKVKDSRLRLMDGNRCDVKGTGEGLKVLEVPQYTKMDEVDLRIRNNGGYTKSRLIIYSQEEILNSLNKEIDKL